jgi:hypothetical protein
MLELEQPHSHAHLSLPCLCPSLLDPNLDLQNGVAVGDSEPDIFEVGLPQLPLPALDRRSPHVVRVPRWGNRASPFSRLCNFKFPMLDFPTPSLPVCVCPSLGYRHSAAPANAADPRLGSPSTQRASQTSQDS